jgi:hypothetical protein
MRVKVIKLKLKMDRKRQSCYKKTFLSWFFFDKFYPLVLSKILFDPFSLGMFWSKTLFYFYFNPWFEIKKSWKTIKKKESYRLAKILIMKKVVLSVNMFLSIIRVLLICFLTLILPKKRSGPMKVFRIMLILCFRTDFFQV